MANDHKKDVTTDTDVDIDIESSEERTAKKPIKVRGTEVVEVNWFKKNLMSRKFITALVLFVTVTIFFGFGLCNFDEWADFTQWIFLIYVGGNAAEHVSEGIKKS